MKGKPMKEMVRVKDRQSCIMNPTRANRTIPRAKEAWNKRGPIEYKTLQKYNLHGCSNEGSFGPTHQLIAQDKHWQDVSSAEESCSKLCSNVDVEGASEARESVEDEDANHCEGDSVLPTYPGRGIIARFRFIPCVKSIKIRCIICKKNPKLLIWMCLYRLWQRYC